MLHPVRAIAEAQACYLVVPRRISWDGDPCAASKIVAVHRPLVVIHCQKISCDLPRLCEKATDSMASKHIQYTQLELQPTDPVQKSGSAMTSTSATSGSRNRFFSQGWQGLVAGGISLASLVLAVNVTALAWIVSVYWQTLTTGVQAHRFTRQGEKEREIQ